MSPLKALSPKKRYNLIKTYIVDETEEEIAKRCRCDPRTIDRDIRKMKESGEWWEWIEKALHRYGRSTQVSDDVKFKEYAKLYGKKFITEKHEQSTEVKGTIIITGWSLGTTDDNGELHPTSRSETVP